MNILANRNRVAIALIAGIITIGAILARPAVAQAAGVDQETQFVFNTFAFLVWGALVM